MPDVELSQDDEEEIIELLMGRRVVTAEEIGGNGKLTLDDGRIIHVLPNIGCGGCPDGNYDLTELSAVDNIITSVKVLDNEEDKYQIFVYADNQKINLLTVEGYTGTGYYGYGYKLIVTTKP